MRDPRWRVGLVCVLYRNDVIRKHGPVPLRRQAMNALRRFLLALLAAFLATERGSAAENTDRPGGRQAQEKKARAVVWDIEGPVRDFEDVCFDNRPGSRGLTLGDARKLLGSLDPQVPTMGLEAKEGNPSRHVEFHGLARVRVDWCPPP